jgi:hypothetical protein
VENLQKGDMALDCFGNLVEVTSIDYRGVDIAGDPYVGYSTRFGDRWLTNFAKAGEVFWTTELGAQYGKVSDIPVKEISSRIGECSSPALSSKSSI